MDNDLHLTYLTYLHETDYMKVAKYAAMASDDLIRGSYLYATKMHEKCKDKYPNDSTKRRECFKKKMKLEASAAEIISMKKRICRRKYSGVPRVLKACLDRANAGRYVG